MSRWKWTKKTVLFCIWKSGKDFSDGLARYSCNYRPCTRWIQINCLFKVFFCVHKLVDVQRTVIIFKSIFVQVKVLNLYELTKLYIQLIENRPPNRKIHRILVCLRACLTIAYNSILGHIYLSAPKVCKVCINDLFFCICFI